MKHLNVLARSHFLPQNIKLRTYSNNLPYFRYILLNIDIVNFSLSSWFCNSAYKYIDESWLACSVLAEEANYLSLFEMCSYSVESKYFVIIIFLKIVNFNQSVLTLPHIILPWYFSISFFHTKIFLISPIRFNKMIQNPKNNEKGNRSKQKIYQAFQRRRKSVWLHDRFLKMFGLSNKQIVIGKLCSLYKSILVYVDVVVGFSAYVDK